jgi:multidrug resistance efflux pump
MACFYCNVSDAWLFPEKSKRLWVTLAGGYFELFLWAWAVFVWRVTTPDSLVNYLAFVVLSACGVQTLFNFNPLLKPDGYHLLSDWLEVPNLQPRAANYAKSRLRWLLWGAARAEVEPRGRCLMLYGLVSWLYSLGFLGLSLVVMTHFLGARLGVLGVVGAMLLLLLSVRGLFHGVSAGEVTKMLRGRHRHNGTWALLAGDVAAALYFVQIEDRVGGAFQLRPATRAEVRAPLAAFVQAVYCDKEDRLSPGAPAARLEVVDRESRLAQKQAEMGEVQAKLRLLEIGPRPEEVAEQRQRVARAQAWRDLAEQDLRRTRRAHAEDLDRFAKQVVAAGAEVDVARDSFQRAQGLASRKALPEEQLREAEGKYRVSQARLAEDQAAQRAHQAKGTLEAEAELARRAKELADAQAAFRLLEAGTRPQDIQAEQARLARLREEVRHLEGQRQRQAVASPVAGLVTTAHVKEKIGQYLREGDLLCVVEEPAVLEAEITLAEQDVARVHLGQAIALKARAVPFETYSSEVARIAPAAGWGEAQSNVIVYCRFERALEMRPPGRGIGGYARWAPGADGEMTWVPEAGLLTGAAGIALAKLAATTSIEPAWDRLRLVAIPPA